MWVFPDEQGIRPGYEQLDINDDLARGGWVTVASGMSKHRDRRAAERLSIDGRLPAADA